jgi:hypothetical protein
MTLAGLIVLHVAAAIWHRNVRQDTVFNRISFGPGRARRRAALAEESAGAGAGPEESAEGQASPG